jgi:hypothetical protein
VVGVGVVRGNYRGTSRELAFPSDGCTVVFKKRDE